MDKLCPVIFINSGIQDYLIYSLAQAKRVGRDGPVLLFGDTPLPDSIDFVRVIPIQDFSKSARELAEIYTHFSINAPFNELVCLQRWFVLRDFLRLHPIERFMHLDSDVLLFAAPAMLSAAFEQYEFALSTISAHTSILSPPVIEELCALILGYYAGTDRNIVERFEEDRAKYAPHGPSPRFNISDMSFINFFRSTTKRAGAELTQIHRGAGGSFTIDGNINADDIGFEMNGPIKRIEWIDGSPFGTISASGEKVRFCTLHFSGPAKPMVAEFFQRTGDSAGAWRP